MRKTTTINTANTTANTPTNKSDIDNIVIDKKKTKKQTDKYLILCNIKKPDVASDQYISNLEKAFSPENFYPILLYPEHLSILTYSKNKTISFKKILQPLEHKHNFTF